ncbi:MAG TPA: filamentous hemagglutinin N-terminal domain-containing protein [Caulobacteraceae bacterium]
MRSRLLCCSAVGLVLAAIEILPARAAPAGASIPAGVAAAPKITTAGPVTDVNLNQSRTLIDWSSFKINPGETVNFRFNSASDIVLNRVLGQAVVDGALNGLVGAKTGGSVWLYGGQGVVFGPNARVNVGSLLATTTPLSSVADFLSGSNTFTFQGGQSDASILARSGAQLSSRGALALIAPSVATEAGAQVSAGGAALYGAAQNFRIHFDASAGGDLDLVDFEVPSSALEDGSVSATPLAIAGDTTAGKVMFATVSRPSVMNAVISLGGLVTAKSAVQGEDGDIILSATGAPASVQVGGALQADRSVSLTAAGGKVEVSGVVTARDASGQGGTIVLGDGSTGSAQVDAGARLDVASLGAGQTGGRAVVTGAAVDVEGTVDASGPAGGGAIRIGGGFHGQEAAVANADQVAVAPGAVLTADATASGDGGSVVLWSQNYTAFGGLIQARGGPNGGNGGQAEVSSANLLNFAGFADLRAPRGATGGLLLDPNDIDINTGGGGGDYTANPSAGDASVDASSGISLINPNQIDTQIQGAALTISASGTITFDKSVNYSGAGASHLLTLDAGAGFVFKTDAFNVTGAGALNVTLNASYSSTVHTGFTLPVGTNLDTNGGTLTITGDSITLNSSLSKPSSLRAAQIILIAPGGDITSAAQLVTTTGLLASATGDIGLTAGNNSVGVSNGGTISLGGANVAFSNNQATSFDPADITAGDSLSLTTTTGDLSIVNNPLTAPQDLSLTSNSGAVNALGLTATSGNLTLNGDTITLNGPLAAGGGVSLTQTHAATALALNQTINAAGVVTLDTTGSISQSAGITAGGLSATSHGGDVVLDSHSNAISGAAGATISAANGAATLYDSGALTVGGSGVGAHDAISLTGASIALNGNVTSSHDAVSLTTLGGALQINSAVGASTNLDLEATGGGISQTAPISAATLSVEAAGQNVGLTSTSNAISGTVSALSGAAVSFTDASPLTVTGSGVTATGALNLTSAGLLTVNGAIGATGDVNLTGKGLSFPGVESVTSTGGGVALVSTDTAAGLTISAGSTLSSAGFVTLTAYNPATTSYGPLTVNAAVSAPGAVNLTGSSITLGGGVTLASTTASGGLTIDAVSSALTLDGSTVSSAAFLTATSGGLLTVNNGLGAVGDITLTGNGIGLGAGGSVISSGGKVTMNAQSGALTTGAPSGIGARGDVSLTGNGISLGLGTSVASTNGGVSIDSTDSVGGLMIPAGGTVSSASFLNLTALNPNTSNGGPVTVNAPLSAPGLVSVTGSSISLGSGVTLTSTGPSGGVTLDATASDLTVDGSTISSIGPLNFTSGGLLTVNNALGAVGDIGLTANGISLGNFASVVSTGGKVTMDAQSGTLTTGAPVAISGFDNVSLTARGISLGLGAGVTSSHGGVTLDSTDAVLGLTTGLGAVISSASFLNLTTLGPLTVDSSLTAPGNISLTGVGIGFVPGATVSSTGGGGVSMDAKSGVLSLGAALTADGDVSLTGASITMAGQVTSNAGSVTLDSTAGALPLAYSVTAHKAVTLEALGDITESGGSVTANQASLVPTGLTATSTNGAVTLNFTNMVNGNVTLSGLHDVIFVNGQTTTIDSATSILGQVVVETVAGDLNVTAISAPAGAVTLEDFGNGTVSTPALTANGDVVLYGSVLNLGGTVASTNGAVTLEAYGTLQPLVLNQQINAHGSVSLYSFNTGITQSAAEIISNGLLVSAQGVVNLGSQTNAIDGTVTNLANASAGAGTTLYDSHALTLTGGGNVNLHGGLNLTSAGVLTVNGGLSAPGNIALKGSDISLSGSAVQSTAGGLSLWTTGAQGLTVSQSLSAASGQTLSLTASAGDITQNVGIVTAANLSATATAGSVNLNSTSNGVSGTISNLSANQDVTFVNGPTTTINGANVTLGTTGSLDLESSGGNLTVTGPLSAPGALTLKAGPAGTLTTPMVAANGDIFLYGGGIGLGGSVTSTTGGVKLQTVLGPLTLNQQVQAAGVLELDSNGPITQSVKIGSTGLVVSSNSAVTLDRPDNTIDGTVTSLTAPSVTLVDSDLMQVAGSGVHVTGDLNLTSTAGLTVTGALFAGGNVSLTGAPLTTDGVSAGLGLSETTSGDLSTGTVSANNNIGLTGAHLDVTGTVTSANGAVALDATAGSLAVDNTVQAATTVTLTAHDDITQTAKVMAGAGLIASSTNDGDITLALASNAVIGPVSLTGHDISFTDMKPLSVSAVSASGALNLTSLDVLSVTGALSAHDDLALTGTSLNLGGAVHSLTGGVTLDSTAAALTINQAVTAGAVHLISAGAIGQGGAGLITTDTLTGQSAGGTLLNLANAIGAVGPFSNTGSGNLSIASALDLTLAGAISNTAGGASLAGRSLTVNSPVTGGFINLTSFNGGISGSGVLTASGGLTAQATGGAVSLTAGNQVTGATVLGGAGVTFVDGPSITINPGNLTSTGAVALTSSGDITVNGAVSLPGSLSLTAGGMLTTPAITTTSGDVSLTGAAIALGGDVHTSTGAVTLQSTATLDVNHNISTAGTATLTSGAQVIEDASGGTIAAGHLAVRAGSGIALNNANAVPIVDSLVDTGGGDIQLSTTGALTLSTPITAPGSLTLSAGGVLAGGTLNAAGGITVTGASGVTVGALTAGQGITGSSSAGSFTSGVLTLGGNLSLTAAGTVTVPQIQAQPASQLAITAANVSLGAASGQTADSTNTVQGVISVSAQQDASLNLDGDVNIGQLNAGHDATVATTNGNVSVASLSAGDAASVSVQNGSAQVASATLGSSGVGLSLATTGGDAVLGAAAGATPGAGNIVTAPASAAISVSGGRDAVVNLAGPVTVANLTGGRDAVAHTNSGDLAVASAQAGRNLTVTSDSGSANLKTAALTGSGALTLTAATTATLGRLPGEAAPTPAGTLTLGAPSQETVTLAAPSVVVDLASGAALNSVTATAGDAVITTAGDLSLGKVSASGRLTVAANAGGAGTGKALSLGDGMAFGFDTTSGGGNATIGSASAGGDIAISSAGAANLTQVSTPGNLSVKAGGGATIGTASAGGLGSIVSGAGITIGGSLTGSTLLLRGQQLTLNGPVQATQACGATCAAPTLTIESAGGALTLGDNAGAASGGMQISNTQFASIKADAVTFYAGDTTNPAARGNVTIGDLTLDGAKIKTLSVLAGATSKVSVTGAVVPAAGGGSALVIGGQDAAQSWTPLAIYVSGGLGDGSASQTLAGEKPLPSVTLNAVGDVLFGRDAFVTAITGVEAAGHANTINVDRNIPPGVAVAGADLNHVFVTADTLTVRANGVIAQENTGITGTSNGIILTNRAGARYFATLGRTGPPLAGSNLAPQVIDLSLAYFNAAGLLINQQIAAASPGVNLGELPRSDLYRINGCTIGAAGSCTPLPNTIVDVSIGKLVQDIRLIAQAPPPAYDPTITGAGNEEIWRTNACTGGTANGNGTCQ